MAIETIRNDEKPPRTKTIKFKQIKAVYEKFIITEEMSPYVEPLKKFSSSKQVFETFKFLQNETKEYFITLHLRMKRSCHQ